MSDTTITEERIDEQKGSTRDEVRAARELVPVGHGGVQITDLAQQVDYAQSMAKAKSTLPEHLRNSVGDCLAIIDIASRAGLSPYMVANKTYVQNGRICFESQLFHAFAQSSGLLYGDLTVAYEGEAGDRVCIITGWLKAHPNTPRVHKSPPLKDLHPGYVLKKAYGDGETGKRHLTYAQGQELIAKNGIEEGMKLFAQGSPLWIRKPDVQQFYDTSRDWIRIYCPRAVLGIYTVDEMMDYGPEFARDISPPTSGLSERLRGGAVNRDEGHGAGGDVAKHMQDAKNGTTESADNDQQQASVTPSTAIEGVGLKKAVVNRLRKINVELLSNLLQMSEAEVAAIPDMKPDMVVHIKNVIDLHGFVLRTEGAGATKSEEADKAAPVGDAIQQAQKPAGKPPKNVKEWDAYARAWIAEATSSFEARKRWTGEMALRNDCGVVTAERDPVKTLLDAKCEELGEAK